MRIFINGEFFSSMLCTPRDMTELTIGWLFNQGMIESMKDIASLGACEDMTDVQVHLVNGKHKENGRNEVIRTSACMGGEISYAQFFKDRPKLSEGPAISIGVLKSLMKETLSMAHGYKRTGGIHCAAMASAAEGRIVACFEDVGRHNAVDKVTGRMLLAKMNPGDAILLTSGRISSEMALKAAHSGIPIVGSITTCTDLALRIAEETGLTIAGRILSTKPVVWSGQRRIVV